jgi:hypothetical protein
MLTDQKLREVLAYDLTTGVFTWRRNVYRAKAGQEAGGKRSDGYLIITINQHSYRVHRLAWFYVYGEWPCGELDHINGNPSDNRIANLRVASRRDNVANTRRKCSSGNMLKGVTPARDGVRYKAQIRLQGKNTYIGIYDSELAAHRAYCDAAEKEFGAFARAE